MTQPIVISFLPDGGVEYTRNPHFAPFGGEGRMRRVTDITKADHGSFYAINWLLGPYAGTLCSYGQTRKHLPNYTSPIMEFMETDWDSEMWFTSYEDAVQHEIAMLNAMRKEGIVFDGETTATTR